MDYYLNFPPNMDLTDYYWVVLAMATLLLIQCKVAMDADYKKLVEQEQAASAETLEENIILKERIQQLEDDNAVAKAEFEERYDEYVTELQDIMDKFNAVTKEAKIKEEKATRDIEFMRNVLLRARKLQDLDENPIHPINPVPPPYRQPPPLTRTSSLKYDYTTGK
jgi:hypothetical protein